jgi:hypothetical protein
MNKVSTKLQKDERGWALLVAMVVMALLLGLGLATLALVDTQQSQSRQQRIRESSFNLAEGMLYSSSQILARRWPSLSTQAFPDQCTQSNYTGTNTTFCTDPATVTAATGGTNPIFGGADFSTSGTVNWAVQVRDNGDSQGRVLSNYDQTTANGTQRKCSVTPSSTQTCASAGGTITGTCNATAGTFCKWDFNGDNQIFVRAEAQVRGGSSATTFKRRLVALLKLELRQANFNSNVVQSAYLVSSNNGQNKTLVDAQGSSTTASTIVLTCNPNVVTNCPDPQMKSSNKNQINPPDQYATNQTVSPGLSQDDYDGLQVDHLYNNSTGCPGTTDAAAWTGTVVFDFSSSSTVCTFTSNGQLNSPSAPGFIVINCGVVRFLGTVDFYGIIYGRNTCNSSGIVVDLSGGGIVHGGVTVDGAGGVSVGGAEPSIIFDPNSLGGGKVAGTAGLVQSTWRELTATQ